MCDYRALTGFDPLMWRAEADSVRSMSASPAVAQILLTPAKFC